MYPFRKKFLCVVREGSGSDREMVRWARKTQPPGQLYKEGWAALRSRSRPDFGMFTWNFEIWTVVSGSNCEFSCRSRAQSSRPLPRWESLEKGLGQGRSQGMRQSFLDTSNSLCLTPASPRWVDRVPISLSWGEGPGGPPSRRRRGWALSSECYCKGQIYQAGIWLSFCSISIFKSCSLILKLTQLCGLGIY